LQRNQIQKVEDIGVRRPRHAPSLFHPSFGPFMRMVGQTGFVA